MMPMIVGLIVAAVALLVVTIAWGAIMDTGDVQLDDSPPPGTRARRHGA
ncbi:MAG TPA: hypothetical protein VI341_12635 [Actinomycetota bacterium]